MASAEEFFQRLRARVAARKDGRPAPPVLPPPPATAATKERFFEELTRVGVIPHATNRAGAAGVVVEVARAAKISSFAAWREGLVAELAVGERLISQGLRRIDSVEARALAEAQLALSGCDLAFAENGALLLCARAQRGGRLITALPRTHVVLVGRSQLVYGLEELPATLRRLGLPSTAILHTGPTFSGDIEAIVIVGAHGPAELHVVWVEDA